MPPFAIASPPPPAAHRPSRWGLTGVCAPSPSTSAWVSLWCSHLAAESIQPHRFRCWKDSPDPEFAPKMLAVIGLYMQPPRNAVVLSVDEKTSIPALDRTQPRLPMKPHRIERLSHEYKRHGTASLLASLEVHSGQVRAEPIHRNNSATFIRFLRRLLNAYPAKELYIIADNGSSHRSNKTVAWVAKQKRAPQVHPDPCQLAQPNRDLVRHPNAQGRPSRNLQISKRTR